MKAIIRRKKLKFIHNPTRVSAIIAAAFLGGVSCGELPDKLKESGDETGRDPVDPPIVSCCYEEPYYLPDIQLTLQLRHPYTDSPILSSDHVYIRIEKTTEDTNIYQEIYHKKASEEVSTLLQPLPNSDCSVGPHYRAKTNYINTDFYINSYTFVPEIALSMHTYDETVGYAISIHVDIDQDGKISSSDLISQERLLVFKNNSTYLEDIILVPADMSDIFSQEKSANTSYLLEIEEDVTSYLLGSDITYIQYYAGEKMILQKELLFSELLESSFRSARFDNLDKSEQVSVKIWVDHDADQNSSKGDLVATRPIYTWFDGDAVLESIQVITIDENDLIK